MSAIDESFPLLDAILEQWKPVIGDDYDGYRNHVQRMVRFCCALRECSDEEKQKIMIAAAFHDIGIWIENTVDYIPPSIPPAMEYLQAHDLESWSREIEQMISEHHKLTKFKDASMPLVEVFRQGDLVDFSFGTVKFGLPPGLIKHVKKQFPNAGFHKGLARRAGRWFLKHPLNPAPMMKW